MSHPEDEQLAGVALGETADPAVAIHLATCRTCRDVVAELGGVLDVARSSGAVDLVAPPDRVWDAVRAGLAETPDAATPAPPGPLRVVPSGPEPHRAAPERGVPRRQLFGWLAAAAVSGVVAGAGGTWLLTRPVAEPTPLARVDLATLDTLEVLGEADVRETPQGVALAVRTRPLDPGEGFLEVWLINRDLARMVSVGVLPAERTEQSFPIARRLLEEGYVVVDISREGFDDRPEHSGDSVVRGQLPL